MIWISLPAPSVNAVPDTYLCQAVGGNAWYFNRNINRHIKKDKRIPHRVHLRIL